jgi:hypothetical protein
LKVFPLMVALPYLTDFFCHQLMWFISCCQFFMLKGFRFMTSKNME